MPCGVRTYTAFRCISHLCDFVFFVERCFHPCFLPAIRKLYCNADSLKAPNTTTLQVQNIIGMYDAILFGMSHKILADCSQFESRKGVFFAPERINPVHLFRTDGSVWTSFDISIRIHKEDDIVRILLDHIAVAFGTWSS